MFQRHVEVKCHFMLTRLCDKCLLVPAVCRYFFSRPDEVPWSRDETAVLYTKAQ